MSRAQREFCNAASKPEIQTPDGLCFSSLRLELDRRSVVTRHDPHVTNCAALHVRLPGARS
jgi:hypothetical protein